MALDKALSKVIEDIIIFNNGMRDYILPGQIIAQTFEEINNLQATLFEDRQLVFD